MDEQIINIFRSEAKSQSQYILLAVERLQASPMPQAKEIWMHLQTVVVSAANLSKIFWGSSGRSDEARRPLRDLLEIRDDSPLRDPDLRNDFEHFDERLEAWFERPDRGGYVARNISFGSVGFDRPDERFHHFDGGTGVVSFWEHAVSIPAIVAEAERIVQRCQTLEQEG